MYARKLHVLKMLEKYYIYLNEEEIEILKGMVQDCKRRKQEYALEDCGTTSEEIERRDKKCRSRGISAGDAGHSRQKL